jgi:microsomal dipeptidase-like Zn-dependent dipeptidase
MAGGCYSIRSLATGTTIGRENGTFALSGSAEPFHFQATDLGRYLMFGSQSDFLAAEEGAAGAIAYAVTRSTPGAIAGGASVGATDAAADMVARSEAGAATGRGATVVAARDPSELADWEIDRSSADAFTIRLPATGQSLVAENGALSLVPGQDAAGRALFGFALTTGCAEFPEIEVNVTGEAPVAGSAADAVRGYLDAHVHMMAFEFIGGRVRCGRPWHAYGVARALVDCPDHGPHGETAALEMVLSGGDPVNGHSPEGWPSFAGWPKNGSLTHEQIYYRWLERAWRGGLRMMTNLLVDNHALCAVYPFRRNSCNEMDGVRLQAQRIRELERYIDAQSGGPGEGWFRIVTDPFQARDVMNAGKLAVVLGIEVSTPLDCGILHGVPMCSEEKIDQQLDAVYALGVRQMELANKFDNALTGVTGDEGGNGVVVNSGNRAETGQFWPMGTCADPALGEDKLQYNAPDQLTGRDSIFGGVLEVAGTSGVAPVYPQGPHCNAIGLTALGAYAVQGLIDRGIIFDPDHMSAHARHQALDILQDILQEGGHAGVVSSHSWADETVYPRVYTLGGVVTPHAGGSQGFLSTWRTRRAQADSRYTFGIGFGSDMNGFSVQGAPRNSPGLDRVTYPFTGFGGVTIQRQHSGTKLYDVNTDGVAHYGLYPDWVEDLRILAEKEKPGDGALILEELARGAEAYLQMWERAIGIAPDACRQDLPDLTDAQFGAASTGMTWSSVLEAVGQPKSRQNAEFRYCLTGDRTGVVSFDSGGVVTSTAIS